jgi:hypothetical protein
LVPVRDPDADEDTDDDDGQLDADGHPILSAELGYGTLEDHA